MRLASILLVLAALAASAHAQPAAREVPVTFASGDVALAGSVLLPPGDGPFPGAVLVHGSGPSDRSNPWTAAYAEALVARGVAVLYPDKRGAGASGGDWRTASISDLADDALAAVEALRQHPGVDPARVGVIGFSQGGHVVPVAASRSAAVAFVVDVSGSVVPLAEQVADEVRMMAEREGLPPDAVAAVLDAHYRAVHYVRTSDGWEAYADALAALRAGPHGEAETVQGFPSEPDAPAWAVFRALGDFDPMPTWHLVRVPTLFLYGGRDENIDVAKSVARIEAELGPAGLPYSVLLFGRNGHGLYREDALDFVARWIHDGGAD